jgi:VanZ family protein
MAEPRGGARVLLGVYLLFIVYGSFFPFRFATEPVGIADDLANAFSFRDAGGRRNVSLPDLAANTLLGLPLGFLLIASGLPGSTPLRRVAASGLCGLLVASAVEAGQLFSPGRMSSIFDVAGQVAGTLAGALAGEAARGSGGRLSSGLAAALRERPLLAPLAALLAILTADALYPYAVTFDVSTVWGNVKDSIWRPFAGAGAEPWHALLVDRILPYAAVTALTLAVCAPADSRRARLTLCALPVAFAAALEVGKLLVEGRSLRASHVTLAAVGALLGWAVAPRVGRLTGDRARWALAVAGVALVAYHELRPFDFTGSMAAVRAKLVHLEWVPFASYIRAEPETALFDVGKKLVLGGLLGLALRGSGARGAVGWTLLIAAVLEAGQLTERSHQTSVTDVGLLALGAWLAGRLLIRYRAVLDSPGDDAAVSPRVLRHE